MMEDNFYEEYHEQGTVENSTYSVSETSIALVKVFLWMFVGVALSFLVAFFTQLVLNHAITNGNSFIVSVFMIAMVISFIIELVLCYRINKNAANAMTANKALSGFLVYSMLNGLSLSTVFILLDAAVLYQILAAVAIYFLVLAGFTALFRKKLTTLWSFAGVGLLTLVVVSVLVSVYSLIAFSRMNYTTSLYLYLGVSIFGLIVFSIMTIADVNRIKTIIQVDHENQKGAVISGAFVLYLDFINILLYVIRIVIILGGNRRRK